MTHSPSALLLLLPWVLAGSLSAQEGAGIHRTRVGALEVTALLDAEMQLPPTLLKGLTSADATAMLGGSGAVSTPVNAFLVRIGSHLVLVDTGARSSMSPGMGQIQDRLQQAGVALESIEAVLITHFHNDHLGGLLRKDGQRAFPKAVLRVSQAESDYWLSPATLAALPENYQGAIKELKATLAPYQAAGAYQPFAPGQAPFPGVKALATPGHTPGHTVYVFGEGAQSFWAVGDIVHFGKVQFQRPEVTVSFDTDNSQAAGARIALWELAAKEGAVLGGAHLAFPGLGHVQALAKGFAWLPLGPGVASQQTVGSKN